LTLQSLTWIMQGSIWACVPYQLSFCNTLRAQTCAFRHDLELVLCVEFRIQVVSRILRSVQAIAALYRIHLRFAAIYSPASPQNCAPDTFTYIIVYLHEYKQMSSSACKLKVNFSNIITNNKEPVKKTRQAQKHWPAANKLVCIKIRM